MKLEFYPITINTFGRLDGITSFLDVLDRTLPELEWADNKALEKKAVDENWEFPDFEGERQILEAKFKFWLPRFTAYSVLTLLYTVLETQLVASAKQACSHKQASFLPSDIRGSEIEASALYLKRLDIYDLKNDPDWQKLCDLRDIRNLIVHRAGTKGQSDKHRSTAQRLEKSYANKVSFPNNSWCAEEVWISVLLCRDFIATVEGVFDRVFDSLGLPPRWERRTAEESS